MNRKEIFHIAEKITQGVSPGTGKLREIANIPDSEAFSLLAGADLIRDFYFGKEIHLCMICNGKSGRCSENCNFCSQSTSAKTDAPVYPLLSREKLVEGGTFASEREINRYSIVTSGKRLPRGEVEKVASALAELDGGKIGKCASLGILGPDDFRVLKEAGVRRYHHNLETAKSHFGKVCTTHTYRERTDTIKAAKAAGLSICSGGIFGIGETDEQVLELALDLKELDVDAVPVNFLVPIEGTPAESFNNLNPLRCLKIIALFRFVLPDKDILICGGREPNLKDLASNIFYAGANGIMTGDYLTTSGKSLESDLDMIGRLGLCLRKNNPIS